MISDYKRLTKNKYFIYLWISQFVSQIAVHTLNFLMIIRIFEQTGSTIASSLVWIAFIIPAITVGPFAAAYVDLTNRKRVLISTNLAQALILLVYAFTYEANVFLAYGVVLLYSFFNQFYIPAETSSLPLLVNEKELPHANSLFLISYQLAMVIGFSLSGLVRQFLSYQYALILTSGFVFVAFFSVQALPEMKFTAKKLSNMENKVQEFFLRMVEGYNFIKNSHEILLPFLTIAALQVTLAVVTVNLPVLTKELLELPPHYSGFLVVPAGVGAVLGIWSISKFIGRGVSKWKIIQSSLAVLTVDIWSMMLLVPLLPFNYRVILTALFILVIGIAFIGVFIPSQVMLQTLTPKNMMARVFGNSWFVTTVATVIPVMFSATITEIFGAKLMFMSLGFGVMGLLLIYHRYGETNKI